MTQNSKKRFGHIWVGFKRALLSSSGVNGVIGTVLLINAVLVVEALFLQSYFGKNVIFSLFWIGGDGFCDPAKSGLGIHCFYDYNLIVNQYFEAVNPWAAASNYPAASHVFFMPFALISKATGSGVAGLVVFLLVVAACLVVPAFWASRGKPLSVKILWAAVLGVVSIPGLYEIDRANSIALAIPAILWFFVALAKGNKWAAVIAVVIAALIKPQLAVLLLAFLAMRWFIQFASAVVAFGVVSLGAYLLWPGFPNSIFQSIQNIIGYKGAAIINEDHSSNVSFTAGVNFLERLFRSIFSEFTMNTWTSRHQGAVAIIVLVCLVILVGVSWKRLSVERISVILLVVGIMGTTLTYHYYLVALLPVFALLMRDKPWGALKFSRLLAPVDSAGGHVWLRGVTRLILIAAMSLTVTRFFLFQNLHGSTVVTSAELIPIAWLAVIALFVVEAWVIGRSAPLTFARDFESNVRA